VNENIITVNINRLGTEITVLCVYAPSNDKVDLEKVQFYEKLNETLGNIGTTREIILLGDFNGHTGKKVNNQVVGPYGESRINDNGERLIDLCESHNLRIVNGYFKHKMIHKFTWEQHTRNLKSIIDYIIVKQKSKFQIHDVRVQRGINCGSDHYVVRAKVYLPIQGKTNNMDKQEENQEKFMYSKYNLDSFQHESTVYLYKKRLDEKLTAKEESDLTEIYENII
jgi:endonuclease/exonuclease/phosphatase family metal-dependent hydrolase